MSQLLSQVGLSQVGIFGANIMAPLEYRQFARCGFDLAKIVRHLSDKTLFESMEPENGYILITRYPASQRIILHCTGKTSSWILHCAICLYCTPKQPQRPQH